MNRKSILTYLGLKYSTTNVVIIIFVVLFGLTAYRSIPRELVPDITIPYIIVTVPYIGASPQDIENLITIPLEKKLSEIKDIDEMKSTSAEGASMVVLQFNAGDNIDDALRKVNEKVDMAKKDLPQDILTPVVNEISLAEFPIINIHMKGNYKTEILRNYADDLRKKLEDITGILNVTVAGGRDREIHINLKPEKLFYYGLSTIDIQNAVRFENINIPSGNVETDNMKFLVRVPANFKYSQNIQNIIIKKFRGKPVFLKDVAEVEDTFSSDISYARIDSQPAVSLIVQKKAGTNLINLIEKIKISVNKYKKNIPEDIDIFYSNDASEHVNRMINTLQNNIITGLLLVLVVLFMFMGWRSAVLVSLAIPLSLVTTFVVIKFMGFTLNMMVLFSLILSLGMLVDNAIVVIENIFRHYHTRDISLLRASLDGASEVAIPVLSSTLTTLSVFVPLIFWPGITGEFMSFLPKTIIVTLTASYIVAMLFDPFLASKFLKKEEKEEKVLETGSKLYDYFDKIIRWSMIHRKFVIIISVFFVIISISLYPVLGKGVQFFPETDPDRASIDITLPDGANVSSTDKIVKEVEKKLKQIPDLKHVSTTVGTGGGGGKFSNSSTSVKSNHAKISLEFVDIDERQFHSLELIKRVRNLVKEIPGAEFNVLKEKMGPPQGAPIQIELFGDNIDQLIGLGDKIKNTISSIPGLYDLKKDLKKGKPEIHFEINRIKAAMLDLNPQTIASFLRMTLKGQKISKFREGENEYDIIMTFSKKNMKIDDLNNLIIPAKKGKEVPITAVGKWIMDYGYGTIRRKDQKRVLSITGNTEGRLTNDVLKDIKRKLNNFNLPSGYKMSFAGENKKQKESADFLGNALLYGIALIALILITQFNSITQPFIILISVFLSIGGVFFGLIATGTPFSIIMTGLGIISLAGVVVNNAIVLIDFTNELKERGYSKIDAAIEAAKIRLRPVLLTAITTVVALLPTVFRINIDFVNLKLDINDPSAQWWGPMATAIVFGLTFATALTLIVVPVLYTLLTKDVAKSREDLFSSD